MEVELHLCLAWPIYGVSGHVHDPVPSFPVSIEQKAGWAPDSVWDLRRKDKSLFPSWIPTAISRSQATIRMHVTSLIRRAASYMKPYLNMCLSIVMLHSRLV